MDARYVVAGLVAAVVVLAGTFILGPVVHYPGGDPPGPVDSEGVNQDQAQDQYREQERGPSERPVEELEDLEPWENWSISMNALSPIQVGKRLTEGECEGSGAEDLTHLPMRLEDIGVIIPYGSTTGAHVTPIDHQYFYPSDFELGEGEYPAYAMSDGYVYLIDYSEPADIEDTGIDYGDYGVYIAHSCTHFYYESILKSLSPRLQEAFEENRDGDTASMYVPVEGGEQIGYIGGNSIDFAVFDTTRQLENFISPELYTAETEKIFIADPFNYYTENLTQKILTKYPRKDEPLGGRIDYDLEGKLRGNWFLQDTEGYEGVEQAYYWKTHLSIYPDHFDPEATMISVGNFSGGPGQFATPRDSPDPATVGVGDGIITYSLHDLEYVTDDGSDWDRLSYAEGLTVDPAMEQGCALFEMPENCTLKAEFFPGTSCGAVEGFTENVRVYER